MLSPNSEIEILDIYKKEMHQYNIKDLFDKFIFDSKKDDEENEIIYFGEKEKNYIKTRDVKGWTDVLYIKKIPLEKIEDKLIYIFPQPSDVSKDLSLTYETLIPIFDPKSTIRKFHGEIKYEYKLFTIASLMDPSNPIYISGENDERFSDLRVNKCLNDNSEFCHRPDIQKIKSSFKNIFEKLYVYGEKIYVYEIKTRSGWFIINNILLYNGDIPKNQKLYK